MASAEPPQDFDRLREAFQHRYEGLSPHLQRIAHFALGDPNRFALQTVAETARETDVQPSTVIRFAKEFGFSGFSEMQRVFRLRLIEGATSFRDRIHEHRGQLEEAAADDPSAILNSFADASVLALQHLKADIEGDALRQAVSMMDEAKTIYVIGQRRAFPVAAYLSYGLIRLEYRCHLLDSVGGMLPQQVATIGLDDLLVAVSFAEYAQPVVDVVSDAHIRKVPVLAITDSMTSPLARNSSLYFEVRDAEVHRFRPLAAPIALAQSLIIALGYYRDARLARRLRERGSLPGPRHWCVDRCKASGLSAFAARMGLPQGDLVNRQKPFTGPARQSVRSIRRRLGVARIELRYWCLSRGFRPCLHRDGCNCP